MSSRSYRYRVLLVDENPRLADELRDLLSSQGYGCEVAMTWQDALKQVRQQVFDLVISDCHLQDKDGVTLIQEMQKIKPGLAGLVLTGFRDMKTVMQDIRHLDAVQFVIRPYQNDKFLKAVEDVINSAGKEKTTKSETADKGYLLDHKVYSHSAISDLERVYPGITQGVWDDGVDRDKWRRR